MYTVYIKAPREDTENAILIYDDLDMNEDVRLIDPKLTKEDNAAGSYEFEVPLCNRGYDEITPYTKDMDVYIYKLGYSNNYGLPDTDDVYWAGRIVDVSKGIDNHKVVYCEGVLGFLNDTIQIPGSYVTESADNDAWSWLPPQTCLASYLAYLLDSRHNSQVADNRKIYLGEVTAVYEPTTWYTNYETTMDVISSIAEATNGHIKIRRSVRSGNSVWLLDLLNDDVWVPDPEDPSHEDDKWRYRWVPNYDQELEYGVNLTDLNISASLSNIVTAVYPLGKRKDTSTIEGIDEYYDISSATNLDIPSDYQGKVDVVSDPNNSNYKYLRSNLYQTVGRIATVVHYDDVTDTTELVALGCLSLTLSGDESYEVEAGAVDASYRNRSLQPIDVYDVIRVIAAPHGVVNYMKVSKAEIPLDHPVDTVFTIGNILAESFTNISNKRFKNINSEIKYLNIKPFEPEPPTPSESEE